MKTLDWNTSSAEERTKALSRAVDTPSGDVQSAVEAIFDTVRTKGDSALLDYTQSFDRVSLEQPFICLNDSPEPEISELDRDAIKKAADNIRCFHEAQLPSSVKVETMKGVVCEKVWRPIETVGLYIPGGSAPLISTLLMLAVPAQIASVKNIVLCTPPQSGNDIINPHILWAAKWLGFEKIYTLGGAQAVAAMTLGTETMPKVDKIFGPGNLWVTEAKKYATSLTEGPAIDMPAGPSEVMVMADKTANPKIIAADLLAQAEHDPLSQAVLVSFSDDQIDAVKTEIEEQLTKLSRSEIATAAMENAVYILASSLDDGVDAINQYAPEHLILNMENAELILPKVNNAGSIFVGNYTPESVGDYASGTNHVLPTSGYARSYSGLGTTSFMKSMTIQTLSKSGLQNLGPMVERLAGLEGLDAHAQSVTKRLEIINSEAKE